MNAYQILGIMSQIDDEMDEQSANEKIKNKVKKLILSSVEQINKIINNNAISTEEKVETINNCVSYAVSIIVSYMKIMDFNQRQEYNKKEKINIDDELVTADSMNRQNGKNAYQTIRVNSLERYGLDGKIIDNTYACYVLAMKDADNESFEELMGTLLRMKKYAWAYSKIKTTEDREQYELKLKEEDRRDEYIRLAKYAKTKDINIGKASRFEKRCPWLFDFNSFGDKSYKSISLLPVGTIEYGSFIIPNENEINEYRVIKQKMNGKVIVSNVFTNINYAKLQDNPEYRRLVVDELLSDLNLNMGIKYLSGYIGKLRSTGIVDFSMEDIAICQKWKEHKKRIGDKNIIQKNQIERE